MTRVGTKGYTSEFPRLGLGNGHGLMGSPPPQAEVISPGPALCPEYKAPTVIATHGHHDK